MKKLPSQDFLKECFEYNKRTGFLTWKVRPDYHFPSNAIARGMNKRCAGKIALVALDTRGYCHGHICGEQYKTSRLIWKLVTGENPKEEVEHKNRVRSDNRWNNLRLAKHHENGRNRNVPANNTSGHLGVHFSKLECKWKAYITDRQRRVHLGTFGSLAKARAVRKSAERQYFGEFAP